MAETERVIDGDSETCDKHTDKLFEIYCLECKSAGCLKCLKEAHTGHPWKIIRDMEDELRNGISRDVDDLDKIMNEIEVELKNTETQSKNVNDRIKDQESWIRGKEEEIKSVLEKRVQLFLHDLNTRKEIKLQAIEKVKNDLLCQKTLLNTFKKDKLEDALNKSNPTFIARFSRELNSKAEELKHQSLPKTLDSKDDPLFVMPDGPSSTAAKKAITKISGI